MAIRVKELHHHAIRVPPEVAEDVQRFYADVLGLESDPKRPKIPAVPGAWMYVGEPGRPTTQIHIMGAEGISPIAKGEGKDPTKFHVALAVDNIDEARAELDRLGTQYWIVDNVVGNVQIFLEDPAGNMIELHQVGTCTCNRAAVEAATGVMSGT